MTHLWLILHYSHSPSSSSSGALDGYTSLLTHKHTLSQTPKGDLFIRLVFFFSTVPLLLLFSSLDSRALYLFDFEEKKLANMMSMNSKQAHFAMHPSLP